MYQIKYATGQVVAAEAQSMAQALDNAVLQQARLFATIIEAAGEANLPMAASQQAINALSTGLSKLVGSREECADAIRELTKLQKNTNLREVSYGCPTRLPMMQPAACELTPVR